MQKNLNFNLMGSNFALIFTLSGFLFSSLPSNAMGVIERAKLKLKAWRAGQGEHHHLEDRFLQERDNEQENKEQEPKDGGLQEKITLSYHDHKRRYIEATYYVRIETKYEKKEKTLNFVYSMAAQGLVDCRSREVTWRSRNPFARYHKTNLTIPAQEAIESKVLVAIDKYKQEYGM